MDRELGFACKLRDNYTMLQHKTLPLAAMQLQNRKHPAQEEMLHPVCGADESKGKAVPDGYGDKDHRRGWRSWG